MDKLSCSCEQNFVYDSEMLPCDGNPFCAIPPDADYFSFKNRFNYCPSCFNDIPGEEVVLGDNASCTSMTITKSQFQKIKNVQKLEPLVKCADCDRTQHQICALRLSDDDTPPFVCDQCLQKKGVLRKENKFTAKLLRTTKLSDYLEARVYKFLKKREPSAGNVIIRVVSSRKRSVKVEARMKARFVESGQLPAEFPYRSKTILAFQENDGVDVFFFGMHVQEYGSDCPSPNTRRVYLAYLKVVPFFEPYYYRTAVHNQVLLGYLDYVKNLGYTMVHIWVDPRSETENCIFHAHPTRQNFPNQKQLNGWCIMMLNSGIDEGIVFAYKTLWRQVLEDRIQSPTELPYFEGDFWPGVMEESIKELDQEGKKKLEQEEAIPASEAASQTIGNMVQGQLCNGARSVEQKPDTPSNCRKNDENSALFCNDLVQKIFVTMEKLKDSFFVVRLRSPQSAASLPPIQDPDPTIVGDSMYVINLHILARHTKTQFSSLRRAKFWTMAMLYLLHQQILRYFMYTCNICKMHAETRYRCQECDDFDLCSNCFNTEGHEHSMIELDLDMDGGLASADSKNVKPREAQEKTIQRSLQILVHTTQCCDANCRLPSCPKMKINLAHAKVCKQKTNGGCPTCKLVFRWYGFHAKVCKNQRCVVPYCCDYKLKVRKIEMLQSLQRQQFMKRLLQQINAVMLGFASAASSAPSVSKPVVQAVAPAYNQQQPPQQSSPGPGTGLPALAPSQPPGGQESSPDV